MEWYSLVLRLVTCSGAVCPSVVVTEYSLIVLEVEIRLFLVLKAGEKS